MDDLIRRQAAIRWVKTECNPYGKPTLEFESGKKVIEHLEQMPSAQPERTKGRWIDDTYCDQCGWTNEVESGFIGSVKGFHFCPNCGAEMRSKEDGE